MMQRSSPGSSLIHIPVVESVACPRGCLLFFTERECVLLRNVEGVGGSKWTVFARVVRILWRTLVHAARAAIHFAERL